MTYDANFIIQQFGGVKKLAKAINKDPATIYRWTYPKKKARNRWPNTFVCSQWHYQGGGGFKYLT
jgi:hypothetical protein